MIDDNALESGESTLAQIFRYHRDKLPPKFSKYLSMKNLGKPCTRQQWYDFRWVTLDVIPGRVKLLMETGLREEPILLQDFKNIGCEVFDTLYSEMPKPQQVFLRGGGILSHLVGARDAIIRGMIEFPTEWILTDAKTANLKNFTKIVEKGLENVYPEYITQIQLYMGFSPENITNGAVYIKCKDDDNRKLYFYRFNYKEFTQLIRKAEQIIVSDFPPERTFDRDSWGTPCKFCKHQDVCYGEKVPQVNCRTCIHSKAIENGNWKCLLSGEELSSEKQKIGCDKHLFIPELLERFEPLEGDDKRIIYKDKLIKIIVINAIKDEPKGVCSKELRYEKT